MTNYDRLKRKTLGDILVDEDLASEEIVISALQEQQRTGRLLSDILLENREIDEYDLSRAIVEQCQAPYVDLASYSFHKDLIEQYPAALLHKAMAVPMDRYGKQVALACQEVPSKEVAEALRKYSPGGLYIYIASAVDIRQVLAIHAPVSEEDQAAAEALQQEIASVETEEESAWKDLFDDANKSVLTDMGGDG